MNVSHQKKKKKYFQFLHAVLLLLPRMLANAGRIFYGFVFVMINAAAIIRASELCKSLFCRVLFAGDRKVSGI